MPATVPTRFFALAPSPLTVREKERSLTNEFVESLVLEALERAGSDAARFLRKAWSPSGRVIPQIPDRPADRRALDQIIIVFEAETTEGAHELLRDLPKTELFKGAAFGADLPLAAVQLSWPAWCPYEATDPAFGTRAKANMLMHADQLSAWVVDHSGCKPGLGVYAIVVDQGVDRRAIPSSYVGGWKLCPPLDDASYPAGPVLPGVAEGGHGTRMAKHILSLAPEAKILDLPLLPPHIYDVPGFTAWAAEVLLQVMADVAKWRLASGRDIPVVLCNAWAVLDSRTDGTDPSLSRYTDNPNHPYNLLVRFADRELLDQVYAAGNGGRFCPDSRCGPDNIGPGGAILGANAQSSVLTVGAVRVDGLRLGYSSEGPAPAAFAADKPDLCAPSQFCNDDDGAALNTGTSTACALAAGGVAAIRGVRGPGALSPSGLRTVLRDTARKLGPTDQWTPGLGWDEELGHGVLDLEGATAQI